MCAALREGAHCEASVRFTDSAEVHSPPFPATSIKTLPSAPRLPARLMTGFNHPISVYKHELARLTSSLL